MFKNSQPQKPLFKTRTPPSDHKLFTSSPPPAPPDEPIESHATAVPPDTPTPSQASDTSQQHTAPTPSFRKLPTHLLKNPYIPYIVSTLLALLVAVSASFALKPAYLQALKDQQTASALSVANTLIKKPTWPSKVSQLPSLLSAISASKPLAHQITLSNSQLTLSLTYPLNHEYPFYDFQPFNPQQLPLITSADPAHASLLQSCTLSEPLKPGSLPNSIAINLSCPWSL